MCIKGGNVFQIRAKSPQEAIQMLADVVKPGDTIVFHRGTYSHFGICISGDSIIDYSDPNTEDDGTGKNNEKSAARARQRSLRDAVWTSTNLDIYYCCKDIECACRQITVSRAIAFVLQAEKGDGDYCCGKYSLLYNNCEHFVYDCVHHQRYSSQSIKGTNYGIALAAISTSSAGVGAAAGVAAGLSGITAITVGIAAITVAIGAAAGAGIGLVVGLTSSMAAIRIAHGVKYAAFRRWCSHA